MNRSFWNERYSGKELVWTGEANRFVVEEVRSLAPGRALDVGAGEGRNSVWLAEQGWKVHAVDFSDVGMDKASQLAASRGVEIETTVADVTQWDPGRGGYDLIIFAYLHLPWDGMRAALRHAVRALAPGGTLVLVGHDRTNIERGHGGPQAPEILYEPEDVRGALEGLEVEKAERVNRTVSLPDGGQAEAIDCLVRASRPSRTAPEAS